MPTPFGEITGSEIWQPEQVEEPKEEETKEKTDEMEK